MLLSIINYVCLWTFIIVALVLSIIAFVRIEDNNGNPISLDKIKSSPLNVITLPKDMMVAPNMYNLGFRTFKGRNDIQTIVIIHSTESKPRTFEEDSCCKVIVQCARWKGTENYAIDTSNSDGLSNGFITQTLLTATTQYNSITPFNIFGTLLDESFGSIDTSSPDGKNEIFFANFDSGSIIAAAFVHGVFSGPLSGRSIIESDIVFNDNFNWGNASADSSKMDFGNILTHELGHYVGLDHPPAIPACADTTMYPTATFGETKKRSLSPDDIQCLQNLYNDPCASTSSSSSSNILNIGYIMILYLLILI
jgi:hypothetical protein